MKKESHIYHKGDENGLKELEDLDNKNIPPVVLQEFFLHQLSSIKIIIKFYVHRGYLKLSVIFQTSHHQAVNKEVRFVLLKLGGE